MTHHCSQTSSAARAGATLLSCAGNADVLHGFVAITHHRFAAEARLAADPDRG